MSAFSIKTDDLSRVDVQALIMSHVMDMQDSTPREFAFAMGVDALRSDNITVWSVWTNDGVLTGCGALKQLNDYSAEIKSMRTHRDHLRKGVAATLLQHIIEASRKRGYTKLSLETGTSADFSAAIGLYKKYGFQKGGAFASYNESPHNQFYHLCL